MVFNHWQNAVVEWTENSPCRCVNLLSEHGRRLQHEGADFPQKRADGSKSTLFTYPSFC